jgi:uncharacterized membrane protein
MHNILGQPQVHIHYQAPSQVQSGEEAWGGGAMAGLIIGTIFIPLIGIIAGAIAMSKPARKSQGTALLCLGIAMVVLYVVGANN